MSVHVRGGDESGQATVEYIVLLSVVVFFFLALFRPFMDRVKLNQGLMRPLNETYARAYKNGLPNALGPDEPGGPELHPRFNQDRNFRIFFPRATP